MWDWTENQIKVVWIRHGATISNQQHRYLGKTDESLSCEGILDLEKIRDEQRYPKVDAVFSSPMKRCLETAQILYPEQKVCQIPEWEEMDFGAFEGKNYLELQGDARYQRWLDSNGTLPFPDGESREAFIERSVQGGSRMLQSLSQMLVPIADVTSESDRMITVAAIVHGGTIMALLSTIYGGNYFDYQVENGAGYVSVLRGISAGSGVGRPVLAAASNTADRNLNCTFGTAALDREG